jgi:hypothetical protein
VSVSNSALLDERSAIVSQMWRKGIRDFRTHSNSIILADQPSPFFPRDFSIQRKLCKQQKEKVKADELETKKV